MSGRVKKNGVGDPKKMLGLRVRDARLRLGINQEELADRAQVDRTYVSSVERGLRNVTLLTLCNLAGALEIDPADLVRGLTR